MRRIIFYCMLSVLAITGTVQAVHPAVAFLGDYFLGKVLDEVFDAATGKPDPHELKRQLDSLSGSLSQMGHAQGDLLQQLHSLRQEVNERTSRAVIEQVVRSVLHSYEDRLSKVDIRLSTAEQRLKDIENLFGYVPIVLPSPLLGDTLEAEPTVHPLMAQYAKLLVRSETNRIELAKLRQTLKDNAPELAQQLKDAAEILSATRALHDAVKTELSARLPDRQRLLQTRKINHPEVREIDKRLASLAWLVAITKPASEGENKGRLPVPNALLGPMCSEILVAFKLSGVAETDLVPLFRILLSVPMKGEIEGAMPTQANGNEAFYEQAKALQEEIAQLQTDAVKVNVDLAAARQSYSPAHASVVTLRKLKDGILHRAANLYKRSESMLQSALNAYVLQLQTIRSNSVAMVAFRDTVLVTVHRIAEVTNGADSSLNSLQDGVWEGLTTGGHRMDIIDGTAITNSLGMKFVPVPGTRVKFCIHETRNADYAAFSKAVNGVDDSWKSKAGKGKEQHPVVYVTWDDANAFCKWLSAKEGQSYRLPTDAEWSIAVGGLDQENPKSSPKDKNGKITAIYPWGGTFPPGPKDGNYSGSADGYADMAPVMCFNANIYGLYDMGGNAWEWCEDRYYPASSSLNVRVLRGGYYSDHELFVRSSCRRSESEGDFDDIGGRVHRQDDYGFRVVLTLPDGTLNPKIFR
jgi:hypothetical protein